MQALNAASRRQTTLMVTHQLEDLADWDAIWVMQDGQIVEQGTYAELSAAGGLRHITGSSSGGHLNVRFATLSDAV
ncbi:hypothetical protein ACNKHK_05445 [Shigella flexneri]